MLQTVPTPPRKKPAFVPDDAAIYLTDNGAAYCGAHLGATARATGRDISGQRIYRLTADDAAFWQAHHMAGHLPACETCKKGWTR